MQVWLIMMKIIPKKLRKFQRINLHSLENLKKNSIWFSKPNNLNDPFDCNIPFNFSDIEDESALIELHNSIIRQLKDDGKTEEIERANASYLENGKPNQRYKDYIKLTYKDQMQKRIETEFWTKGVACFTNLLIIFSCGRIILMDIKDFALNSIRVIIPSPKKTGYLELFMMIVILRSQFSTL